MAPQSFVLPETQTGPVVITVLDNDFFKRYPNMDCHAYVRADKPIVDYQNQTILPKIKTTVFENSARKEIKRRRKIVAARKAAKDLKREFKALRKSVTSAIFKRNRYELLGEELDDVIIESPPSPKKVKLLKKVKKIVIPKITIQKVKEPITPIYESEYYIQNLNPGPLSTRSVHVEKNVDKVKNFVKNLKHIFNTRQYKDQALSDIGPIFSLDCILTSLMSDITMEEFLKNLEKLKPINLCNLIGMALAAQDFKTILGIITAAFELYDFFWTVPAASTHIFCLFLAYAVWWLVRIVRNIINHDDEALPNMFFEQGSFVPQEEENSIRTWLSEHLNIDLTKIPECVMPLIAGVVGVIALITGGKFANWSELKFSKVLKRLKDFVKTLKTIDSAMEVVPKVFTNIISTVAGLFGYDYVSSEDKCVIEFKNELLEFKKEVTVLSDLMAVEPVALLQNTEKLQKMSKIMQSLDIQYEKLIRQKFNTSQVKPLLDDVKVCVKKIHNWARIRNQETSTKIEPVFCQLSGPPGVGKSQIVDHLLTKLAVRCGRTTRFTTYTRNSQEKFWANYAGQDVVIIDEFNQAKTDADHDDIMSVKNPNKCSVNMAIAEEKGQQFVSQFILACSNGLDIINSATVKWRDALNRRRDVLVLMGDQHLDAFKEKYGCFPGAYVDENGVVGNPIVEREIEIEVAGEVRKVLVKTPYFDKEFRHLDFWLVPSLPECRTTADYKETNPDGIVDLMCAHNQKFWNSYRASLANSHILLNELPPPVLDEELDLNSEDGSVYSSISADEYYREAKKTADPKKVLAAMKVDLPVATPPNTKNEVRKIQALAKQREYIQHYQQQVTLEDYDDYDDAGPSWRDNDARSTSKAFVNCYGMKGKVFALVGKPGTGKNRLLDIVQQTWGEDCERVHGTNLTTFIPTKRILIIDDASINKTVATMSKALVNAVYDGESIVKLLYISYNKKNMDKYYDSNDDREFFLRRIQAVKISFEVKEKKLFTKDIYYTHEDTENATPVTFPKMVNYYALRLRKNLDRGGVVDYFTKVDVDLEQILTSLCVAVPEIDPLTVKPDFIVKFKETTMNAACKTLYESPSKMLVWLANGTVSLQGDAREGINIARQFTTPNTGTKPVYPETIEQFICMINNAQFMSERPFITRLDADDMSLIIMPRHDNPKLIRAFKVNQDLVILRNECMERGSEEVKHAMNEATAQEYGNYFKFIEEHQATVAAATETVSEQFPILAGAASIFEAAPFLKSVFSVCAFYLRFIMAGTAISSLLKHHDSCKILFEQDLTKLVMTDEKKRKRIRYDTKIYDDFRLELNTYGSDSAKKLKVHQAFAKAYQHFGTWDYSPKDFRNFIEMYEESMYPDPPLIKTESREVQIPTALAQFQPAAQIYDPVLLPNLVIESLNSKPDLNDEQFIDTTSETILNLCASNSVSIVKRQGARYIPVVHGLMVKGTIGCSVAHFVESDADYCIQFWQSGELQNFPLKIIRKSTEFDTLIFKVDDKRCQKFKNITHFFPSIKSNIAQIAGDQQAILQTTNQCPKTGTINNLVRNVLLEEVQRITSDGKNKVALTYKGCVTALRTQGQILTKNGDCGSPVILCNPKSSVKIIAIHNAADYQYGAGTLIFREYFSEFTNESLTIPPPRTMTHSAVEMIEHQTEYVCDMPVVGIGEVNTSLPTKTKLWTSPLQLNDCNPYQPAILSQFDKRNINQIHPYYKAVSKWAHEQPEINMKYLDQAVDEIAEFYADTCFINQQKCNILTTTDAINAGGNAGLCQLNRATSPGYPWVQYYSKKQDFLKMNGKNENVYWSIDYEKVHSKKLCKPGQLLSDALNQLIGLCKTSDLVKPAIVFAGHIKDEPVKLKKIYEVNSRSFAGAPFDYVIAVRKYFGSAVSAIHNVRHIVPSKIGINPTSMEWHNMFSKMLEVSDLGFDADYQNFDSTIPAVVLKKVVKIYNKIYQKCDPNWKIEDDYVRINLNNALIEPLLSVPHEGKTKIVKAPGGHVSGQPLTADTNCLVNLIYLYMHWLDVFKDEPDMCNFNTFLSFVEAIIYGDDICVAIHPDVIHRFNCQTFYHFLKTMNITITDAAKTAGEPKPFINCIEFEFLKRNFVQKGAYFFGPLKEASFQKMLGYTIGDSHYWDTQPNLLNYNRRVMISTMDSALQEAVFHGPEYYEFIKNHCLKFCRDYVVQWVPLNYNQMVDFKGVPLPKI